MRRRPAPVSPPWRPRRPDEELSVQVLLTHRCDSPRRIEREDSDGDPVKKLVIAALLGVGLSLFGWGAVRDARGAGAQWLIIFGFLTLAAALAFFVRSALVRCALLAIDALRE